jgi:hypothetical protein
VQLGDFLRSDNDKWIVAYCKFLPQSEVEWSALDAEPSPPLKCTRSQTATCARGDSLTIKTQQAALHHLLNHHPCLEVILMQHVKATVSTELVKQLKVLPP